MACWPDCEVFMIQSASLADRVFEHLENAIYTGVYPAGAVLTETYLSQELGVSRTPVREALRREINAPEEG